MPVFNLTKKEEELLRNQFERWKNVLNWKVGPFAFAAVIAAIPLQKYRMFIGVFGMLVVVAAYITARHEFPKIFSELKVKKNRTFKEEIILRGISSYYFSPRSMVKHFGVYLFTVIPLSIVVSGFLEKIGL